MSPSWPSSGRAFIRSRSPERSLHMARNIASRRRSRLNPPPSPLSRLPHAASRNSRHASCVTQGISSRAESWARGVKISRRVGSRRAAADLGHAECRMCRRRRTPMMTDSDDDGCELSGRDSREIRPYLASTTMVKPIPGLFQRQFPGQIGSKAPQRRTPTRRDIPL